MFYYTEITHTHKAGARNTGWNSFSEETFYEALLREPACRQAGTFFPPFFLALRKKGETLVLRKKDKRFMQ